MITPNIVPTYGLDTRSEELKTNMEGFYNAQKGVRVEDCRGTGTVTPDIIHNLQKNINPDISREASLLSEIGLRVHNGAVAANKISASGAQVTYKATIDIYIGKIDEFIENVTIAERNFTGGMKTIEASNGLQAFAIFVAILIFGLLACFGTIMCCIFNPSCYARARASCGCCLKWNRFFLGGLSLLKVCCGLICLVLGLLILAFSFIFANVCHFSHKGIHDRDFTAQVVNDTDAMVYLDLCLFKNSTGDLGELMPITHRSMFKDLTDMFEGINIDYSTINISESETPSMINYNSEINGYADWKTIDYTNPTIQTQSSAPYKAITQSNELLGCLPSSGQQKFSLSGEDCGSLQQSTLADPEPFRNTQTYCLIPSKFSWTDLPTRYSSANPLVSCASAVRGVYQPMKSCVDSHDSKLAAYKSSFNDDIVDVADGLKSRIKTSKESTPGWGDHFEDNNVLTESRAFLKGEQLSELMNCRVMRFATMNFLGSSCDGANTWSNLSFWLMFLGVTFGLLGIMVWCWSLGKMSENAGSRNTGYEQMDSEGSGYEMGMQYNPNTSSNPFGRNNNGYN